MSSNFESDGNVVSPQLKERTAIGNGSDAK
jgi:hypothetical protein